MSSSLKKELQKYFTKEGNRFVFKNGMSLNALALEMWSTQAGSSVDASSLSRVLRGKRLFTYTQLSAFCKVLRLSSNEKATLNQALRQDLLERYKLSGYISQEKYRLQIDNFNDIVLKIRQTRKTGNPSLALKWIDFYKREIALYLQSPLGKNFHNELLAVYAKLLIEKLWVLADTKRGAQFNRETGKTISQIKAISKTLRDKSLETKARVMLANMHYINANYRKAAITSKLDWDFENFSFYKGVYLKNNVLSSAYLCNELDYHSLKNLICKDLSALPLNIGCMAIDALTRASSQLALFRDSNYFLHLSKKIYEQNRQSGSDYEYLRKIQLVRSELFLHYMQKNRSHKNHLESLAREALLLADNLGYQRHAEIIRNLSDKILN